MAALFFNLNKGARHTYKLSLISTGTATTQTVYNSLRYRSADKSLARPGRKQATVTEDFEFHISYL